MAQSVTDNHAQQRYELQTQNGPAFITYRSSDAGLTLVHTEVPPGLEGQGVGSKLVRETLALIRESGRKVTPQCAFVAAYIRKHPELQDLVAGSA